MSRLGRALLALAVSAPLVVSAIASAPRSSAAGPPPKWQRNVVVIVTDDQRWDTLRRPPDAMPHVHSDLMAHGVTFSNAFVVNPQCCPSRASIFTGRYSHGTNVYKNQPPHGGFKSFKDRSTIATWLNGAGYHTALVGKYLNGYTGKYIPPGWDQWIATNNLPAGLAYFNYRLNENGKVRKYGSKPKDYGATVLGAKAANFIERTPSPFFLYFALAAPHSPAVPPPSIKHKFSHIKPYRPPSYDEANVFDKPQWVKKLPRLNAARRASIDAFRKNQYRTLVAADTAVARIITALRDTGRLDKTLIVFTSDNGILWGEHRFHSKRTAYEESIHVPFVVRYDPLVPTPHVDDRLVLNTDIAPTIAELAGVAAPGAEGSSLLQPLRFPASMDWRSDFLVEHLSQDKNDIPTYCAVRSETATYVLYKNGVQEFYDLTKDPFQLTNQARNPAYASSLAAMRSRLRALCKPPPPGYRLP
jgi:arylsulfatase A-like enzyme